MYEVYNEGKMVVKFDSHSLALQAIRSIGGRSYINYSKEAIAIFETNQKEA